MHPDEHLASCTAHGSQDKELAAAVQVKPDKLMLAAWVAYILVCIKHNCLFGF